MVHEVRKIILGREEIISALDGHSRMVPNFMPRGKTVDFDIIDDSSIAVTVATEPLGQEVKLVFSATRLVQPLIRFCLENNIMLPREGRKSVSINPESVSLNIDLALDTLMLYGPATSFSALCAYA